MLFSKYAVMLKYISYQTGSNDQCYTIQMLNSQGLADYVD
jgi:hypothetical protein